MTLLQLRYAITVADSRSMNQAAQKLFISQPSLSAAIRELEDEARYVDKEKVKKKFGVSMQHYSFAVQAFVEMVKRFGMDRYEFSIYETQTYDVIENVKNFRSELGILYLNDFNRKVLEKIFEENNLEFHELFDCQEYVYLWSGHPLAKKKEITLEDLEDYPFLSFDRAATIRFILRRKCSVRMNTNSRSRRMTVRRC